MSFNIDQVGTAITKKGGIADRAFGSKGASQQVFSLGSNMLMAPFNILNTALSNPSSQIILIGGIALVFIVLIKK